MKLVCIKNIVNSEKTYKIKDLGFYVFNVAQGSTREMVSKSVSEIFGVKVSFVNLVAKRLKSKRNGIRTIDKKAYVKLAPGQKIDLENLSNLKNV